ncbi:MAG: hypothetical protein UY16_C0031G0003 [Candidatus Gottesmanbacteria bacterium GW2011_GWA2_47_9]|uniref:Uncharacterized protein n=2 Tax=Candidatus Gottesmaniibacteriota TaxID=1752720 RepID=A0A0G1UN32_9BACT|nr:MAG: hypothetical protein UY16_C0031G0003 [Candidatus Gottesmanbacteria bacterium GW2011_GWA2_47_9]KKU95559.1 MAG: hypothetical protein UY27_C0014G0015 [Candidatus Gottesmanbacteria bacterium GW2011_GWA1_48_13]
MRFLFILLLSFLLVPAYSKKVNAYLDPGTGSYLFQILLGVFFGGLFSIKFFWKKIKTFFYKKFFLPHTSKSDESLK